jgi:serpin B
MKKMIVLIIAIAIILILGLVFAFYRNVHIEKTVYYSSENASIVGNITNNFDFRLYSALTSNSGESTNLFFSPFSISTALTMTAEGAGGTTLREMRSVLGLPNDTTAIHSGYESLLGSINAPNSKYALSTADSVWIQKNFTVKQEFLNSLSSYYDAPAQQADFINNAAAETVKINNWVASKTNNKIVDLIPPEALDDSTRLVLVNAVYFKGNWAEQFDKSKTENANFYIGPTTTVSVPMMYMSAKNSTYYSDSQLQALQLNYQGGNISMLILLPNQNISIETVESGLSAQKINTIRAGLRRQEMDVWLPRFTLTTPTISIKSILISMGMNAAFDQYNANFSGINATAGLFIANVYHKAFIKVDEQGTEAAAATGVVMGVGAVLERQMQFRADHPFIFFIIDNRSGTILFMGREANPSLTD